MTIKEFDLSKNKLKKNYNLTSLKMSDYFNNDQFSFLQSYYRNYTKSEYSKIMGSTQLKIKPEKMKKLSELKGKGQWVFDGVCDSGMRGNDKCELGHSLRYVYYARNLNNEEFLKFGINCVGDFFDVNKSLLSSLSKIKEDMMSEIVDMVVVLDNNLLKGHYTYNCGKLGEAINVMGLSNLSKILEQDKNSVWISGFLKLGLPLPKSVYLEIDSTYFTNILKSPVQRGLEIENIESLKKSRITLISDMFTYSENYILNEKPLNDSLKSDFFNFLTVDDINTSSFVWKARELKLLQIQSFYKDKGFNNDWYSLYELLISKPEYRKNPKYYYGLEILMLFNLDVVINKSFYYPMSYSINNRKLNSKCYEEFDLILEFLASKDFYDMLYALNSNVTKEKEDALKELDTLQEKLNFLRSNLEKEEFDTVKGVAGVRDIIFKKQLTFDDMSEKQKNYVLSIYDVLNNIVNKGTKPEVQEQEEGFNQRYYLTEKPDILAKIQRLQTEADIVLPALLTQIISTVMVSKTVSTRQIKHINDAYRIFVLKEEGVTSSISNKSDLKNKKWNLVERLDIKEKILKIQKHPEYLDINENTKSMLMNILKYNSVSERQIESVERTYSKYFKSR